MILVDILATVMAVAAPLASPSSATPVDQLHHAQLAESFLESMGREPKAPRQFATPESILADRFLLTSVGLFDVWIPAEDLEEAEIAEDYRDICKALCVAQSEWLSWLGKGALEGKQLRESLSEMEDWIDDWDTKTLRGVFESETRNSLELFGADKDFLESYNQTNAAFRQARIFDQGSDSGSDESGELENAPSKPVKLVLMPKRRGFVEFIAYAGWFLPNARGAFWHDGIGTWSQFTLNDLNVIALQYASPTARAGDYSAFYSMKAKDPTGMEQQVTQLGLNELLAYEHGDALPPSLVSGLSLNLITKIYGACHTRIDGDTSGKVTQKREVFVRGGRPEGGILPPNSAESRWRGNYGKDHYAPILKQAQKAGASEVKKRAEKYLAFQLINEHGSQRYITKAPFLGPSAGEEEVVPDAVYGDFLEFTRAYQASFLHWLQHHGEKSKKKAAASFSEFLSRLSLETDASLSAIAEDIYGKPLSDPEASKKSLEGTFLIWLSKQ